MRFFWWCRVSGTGSFGSARARSVAGPMLSGLTDSWMPWTSLKAHTASIVSGPN